MENTYKQQILNTINSNLKLGLKKQLFWISNEGDEGIKESEVTRFKLEIVKKGFKIKIKLWEDNITKLKRVVKLKSDFTLVQRDLEYIIGVIEVLSFKNKSHE